MSTEKDKDNEAKNILRGKEILSSIPQIKEFFEDIEVKNEKVASTKRKSLVKIGNVLPSYGHILRKVIHPPSSGEESDMEEIRENQPSIKDVAETLTDLNTIMIVQNPEDFPKEAQLSLILINLDEWINDNYIKMFLEEVPPIKDKSITMAFGPIKIFDWGKKKCAIVKIKEYNNCELIAQFFYHSCKKKHPTLNSKGEVLEVFMCFDLLELTLSDWYGAILRNLPQNCSDDSIKLFCESYVRDGVKYCLKPVLIKNDYCSIIVMKDLEDAENLCITLNGQEVSKGRKIKVHLHPKICRIRETPSNSQFSQMFNQNGYSFSDCINESNSSMKKCVSLMRIYPEKPKAEVKNNKKKHKGNMINNKSNSIERSDNTNDKRIYSDSNNGMKNKKNLKAIAKSNSIQKKHDHLNESLLSSLIIKKETHVVDKPLADNNKANETSDNKNNASQTSAKNNNNNIMDTMSHLLQQLKETPQSHPISNQEDKKQFTTPTESETPDVNDCNKEEKHENKKKINEENIIEYEPSVITYYTYNMKDQKYYDNRIIEIQEARKYKTSSSQFVELLKIKKMEIENNLNKDKEKKHYINVKSMPINEKYPKERDNKNKRNDRGRDREHDRSRDRDYHRSHDREYDRNREYNNRSRDRDYDKSRDRDYDKGRERNYNIYNEKSHRDFRDSDYNKNRNTNKNKNDDDKEIEIRRSHNIKYQRRLAKSNSRSNSYKRHRSRSRSYSNKKNRKEVNTKSHHQYTPIKSHDNEHSSKYYSREYSRRHHQRYDSRHHIDSHTHLHSKNK